MKRRLFHEGRDLIKIVSGNLKPGSLWYENPSLNYQQIEQIIKAAKDRNKLQNHYLSSL